MTAKQEKAGIIERTVIARKLVYDKQQDMAKALGISDHTKYNKYENRTPLPYEYIGAFCKITKVAEKWLVTGEGPMMSDEVGFSDFIDRFMKAYKDDTVVSPLLQALKAHTENK